MEEHDRFRHAVRLRVGRPQWWWDEDLRLLDAAASRIQSAWRRSCTGQSGEVFFVAGSLLEAKVAQIEKRKHGFTMLFSYLLFTTVFFAIIVLQKSPAQAFNVERALVDLVLDVQLPDDSTLEDIHQTESILPWVSALIDRCVVAMAIIYLTDLQPPNPTSKYDGNFIYTTGSRIEDQHVCHACGLSDFNMGMGAAASEMPTVRCGSWEAHARRIDWGRCWDHEGNRKKSMSGADAVFCNKTCFPPPGTDCSFADEHARLNKPFDGTKIFQYSYWGNTLFDDRTYACMPHFCFSSCARIGVHPEIPHAIDPNLSPSETASAATRADRVYEDAFVKKASFFPPCE